MNVYETSGLSEPRGAASAIGAAAVVVVAGFAITVAVLSALGLLLTHVAAHDFVGHTDHHLTRWLSHHRSPTLNSVTQYLSQSADTLGAIGIAVVVALALAIKRHWRAIGTLFLGLALELAAFLTINTFVNRPRPKVAHLGSVPSTSSFPSGHTAATLVIYLTVALFVSVHARHRVAQAVAWFVAVVMPLAVGFARVYRGMHNPLDVVGGLLLGLAAVIVARAALAAAAPQVEAPPQPVSTHEEKAVA